MLTIKIVGIFLIYIKTSILQPNELIHMLINLIKLLLYIHIYLLKLVVLKVTSCNQYQYLDIIHLLFYYLLSGQLKKGSRVED